MKQLSTVAYVTVLLMVVFVVGSLFTAANLFPTPFIKQAYQGGLALHAKMTSYDDVFSSDLWNKARQRGGGVVESDPARMQEGVTLYTSGAEAKAVLVAADGAILHEWRLPYSEVWNETASVKQPQPDSHVYFRKALAYPNGDLLVVYEGVGDTPYGYGTVKLDASSNVIWSYLDHTHHDVDIGPDGRIYLLAHDFVEAPPEGFENLGKPRLEDYLVILSPNGEEETRIALTPLVADSPYSHMLHTVSSYAIADPLHTNTVNVLGDVNGNAFAFGEPGEVLLSFRELGAIGVVDVEQEKLTWAMRGSWIGQHDIDALDNGHLMLFDNYGNYRHEAGASRVIEFDPQTEEIVWSYAGMPERPLDSAIRSSQERLENGSTLITESNAGRIVEVTQDGEIAWDYLNPDRAGPDGDKIAIICWAQRLPADFFDKPFAERLSVKMMAQYGP